MKRRTLACFLAFVPSFWACSCPDSDNGVHDGDRMRVTVTGLYGGPSLNAEPACPAAIALPPGSEVTLNANFVSTGEDCPSPQYNPESITAPGYSANGQSNPHYLMYASGGCSGIAGNLNFVPIANGNVSFYAGPQQDGGASWVLAVAFLPDPDAGGACDVNGSCTELYVGSNQKL